MLPTRGETKGNVYVEAFYYELRRRILIISAILLTLRVIGSGGAI